VKAFNRRSHLVKKILHKPVLRPKATAPLSIFFNTQAATMKKFSSNITGLSPVTKKTSPTKVNQEKAKEGATQEQPWIVQGVKKTYKQQQNTAITNTNLSQTTHTPPQSPPWDPPSLFPKASVRESSNR
jgi:hypothetical protein